MLQTLLRILVSATIFVSACASPASAFFGLHEKPKSRIIPPLGLGTAIIGGTILLGGAVVAYMHLCSNSEECLANEEIAQAAGRDLALARQELMNCSAGGACSESQIQEIEARAGKARERQKEAKAKARIAAITKARKSPNSGAPGFCEKDKYDNLHYAVESSCKTTPMTCNKNMSKEEMSRRRQTAASCAQARDRMNFECFKGGDESHKDEAARYWKVTAECDEKLLLFR